MTAALTATAATVGIVIYLDGSAKQMNIGKLNRSTYLGGSSSGQKTTDTVLSTFSK